MLTKRNNRSWVFWTFWFWDEYANTMNTTMNATISMPTQWILQSVYGCIIGSLMTSHPAKLLAWFRFVAKMARSHLSSAWLTRSKLPGREKTSKKTPRSGTLAWRPCCAPRWKLHPSILAAQSECLHVREVSSANRAEKMSWSQLDELKLTHRLRLKNASFENTKSISMIHDLPVRSKVLLLRLGRQSATVRQYVVRRRPHLASMMSSSSLTNQLGRFPSAMGRPSFPAFKTYGGGLVVLTAFVVGSPHTPPAWPTVQQHQHGCCTKLAPLAMIWKLSPYACLCTLAVFL